MLLDTVLCALVGAAAFVLRATLIDEPRGTTWDETYIGQHINCYLNGTFYFDVHPSGGKLILFLLAKGLGYDGGESFEAIPGRSFADARLYSLRRVSAAAGAWVVVFVFLAMRWSRCPRSVALVLALMAIFDSALISISRLILLDPLLMLGTAASIAFLLQILSSSDAYRSGSLWAYCCLALTLSLCISSKFVGCVTYAFVVTTMFCRMIHLWWSHSQFSLLSLQNIVKMTLVTLLPFCLYALSFIVHLNMLPNSGNGAVFLSSWFQSTLRGHDLHSAVYPEKIAHGSMVTLKSTSPGCCYLHSHAYFYPDTAVVKKGLQQVTGYVRDDDLNEWLVFPMNEDAGMHHLGDLHDGDYIQLYHEKTESYLAAFHDQSAVTKKAFLVGTVGMKEAESFDDVIWRIDLADDWLISERFDWLLGRSREDSYVRPWRTKFKLHNLAHDCFLALTLEQLPKWGWKQAEVACVPETSKLPSLWYVEAVGRQDAELQFHETNMAALQPTLLEKVVEMHRRMFAVNSRLQDDHEIGSAPLDWPLNEGQELMVAPSSNLTLRGNKAVWMGCLAGLAAVPACLVLTALIAWWKRGYPAPPRLLLLASLLWLGWLIHYLPFFFMTRVLYFHHYLPAYFFSFLALGLLTSWLFSCVPWWLGHLLLGTLTVSTVTSYMDQFATTYGVNYSDIVDRYRIVDIVGRDR